MTATEPVGSSHVSGPARWLLALDAECDAAGLCAFRALFGGILFLSVVRFWAYGWIDEIYVAPAFHFTYFGFDWVKPWPGAGMYVHFGVMAAAAFALCIGLASRLSAAVFFVTFTYAELIEKASYLNHYDVVSLMSLLLAVVPCGAVFSVDAAWRARLGVPAPRTRLWMYWLLRAQLALLYFFAGFAKLSPDWLLAAQPLRTWLSLHADAPGLGRWLTSPAVAYAASYAGAFYDLTIPIWLSWQRTRPVAYVTVVAFHVAVWLLFPIGVFSWVMIVAATLFFDPAWPRRFLRRQTGAVDIGAGDGGHLSRGARLALGAYLLLQLGLPLRYLLYPGDVNWHEQGFRFSWRVMLIEKAGRVEFGVATGNDDRTFLVYPRDELTPLQYKMMSTQPDMIHEYARHLRQRYEKLGHARVRVYADTWASLNGRPGQRLIDPRVDIGNEPRSLWPKPWIVPLETATRQRADPG